MLSTDTVSIGARFRKALNTYPDTACVQRRMAVELCRMIVDESDGRTFFPNVLELGCGTGLLTAELEKVFRWSDLSLCDLVPECARFHRLRKNCAFFTVDLNSPYRYPPADLIVSGAVLQWVAELPDLLARLSEVLRPQGLFAFSTFLEDNLNEVRVASGRGIEYRSRPELEELLRKNGFALKRMADAPVVLRFASPRAVLDHLRATGVTATGSAGFWTRRAFTDFQHNYEQFRLPDGTVSLTYHPAYFVTGKE